MSLRYWIRGQDQELFEITDRMDFGFSGMEQLEEGSASVQTFTIRDPGSTLDLWGHRIFAVEETEAEDPENRFIFIGYLGPMTVKRGPYTTEADRVWEVEVADLNTVLTRRVMVGTGNKRPDETDVERITWVESTHEGELIDDTRYLSTDNPVNMDDNDYLLQPALNVYSDCAQQSGKNYGLTYFGDVGVDDRNPWGFFSLWYDFASSSEYLSTARLSNYLPDIDQETTFYMSPNDELRVDPMRVFSTVIVPYKGSYVTASSDATRTSYARRDQVMNAPNVSKKVTAQSRANRYIRDLDTPEYRAIVTTIVPRAKVNAIRPGMAVQVKATHWASITGDDYVYMRVLSRRVTEISEDDDQTYLQTYELSWSQPVVSSSSHIRLYQPHGPYGGLINFYGDGDSPPPGKVEDPTTGLVELQGGGSHVHWPYQGILINGTGTVAIHAAFTFAGVRHREDDVTVSASVYRTTGTDEPVYIGGGSTTIPADGLGLAYIGGSVSFDVADVSVGPDDKLNFFIGSAPKIAFFRTPQGTDSGWTGVELNGDLV